FALVNIRDQKHDDAERDNFENFGESIDQGMNDILSGLRCGRRNGRGGFLRQKRRSAQCPRKNKSKQKSHELEFRHDRSNDCSNVTPLRRHATRVNQHPWPRLCEPRARVSQSRAYTCKLTRSATLRRANSMLGRLLGAALAWFSLAP